jgi:hypothetical protein
MPLLVIFPSPSALGVPAVNRCLAEKLSANEISRSAGVCCDTLAPEETCGRLLIASLPFPPALAVLLPSFLRPWQIDAIVEKFRWPLCQSTPALRFFFGRCSGIYNLFDRLCGELLSAQPPAVLADGPRWRLDLQPQLDQSDVTRYEHCRLSVFH